MFAHLPGLCRKGEPNCRHPDIRSFVNSVLGNGNNICQKKLSDVGSSFGVVMMAACPGRRKSAIGATNEARAENVNVEVRGQTLRPISSGGNEYGTCSWHRSGNHQFLHCNP